MKKMSCGNCGGKSFSVIYPESTDEDTSYPDALFVQCLQCFSTSKIDVVKPSLRISFGENSDGCLCVFPNEENIKI